MSAQEFRPEKKVLMAAVTTVAATYAYFLLFAQFGFLKSLQVATGGEQGVIKPVLAVMGSAGLAGSILAARIFTAKNGKCLLIAGLATSAAAAAASTCSEAVGFYYGIALAVGLGVGVTTVTLAGLLRKAVGGSRLGTIIGIGTGLAYGFCNLPIVFEAAPSVQAWLSGLIAGIGMLGALGLDSRGTESAPEGFNYSKVGVGLWVLLFFTLVGFDSAVFYIVQHTPALKSASWAGGWQLEFTAFVHLSAAIAAGWVIDRGWIGQMIFVSATLLLTSGFAMGSGLFAVSSASVLYVVAVSLYSVALVFYAAYGTRPGLAALVYGVGGWIASATGIGLAENLHAVPVWLIATAGAIMLTVLLIRFTFAKN